MFFRHYLFAVVIILIFVMPVRYFVNFYRRKKRMMKYVQHLRMPVDYPIVGSGYRFIGKSNEGIMKELIQLISSYETPFPAWLGPELIIFIDQPEDVQIVLSVKSCLEKAQMYRFFDREYALFTAPAHIWKPQRKVLSAAFRINILHSYIPIFNEKAKLLARNIGCMVGKGDFDLYSYLSECTLDMVCATTMGCNLDIQNGKNHDYLEALEKSMALTAKRMTNVLMHPDLIYKQTKQYEMECKYRRESELLPQRIIDAKKIEYFQRNPMIEDSKSEEIIEDNDDQEFDSPQTYTEFIFRMFRKGLIDERNIKDQINLILFAGNDTSSLATSHVLVMLAMHPEIQDRLLKEINEVYSDTSMDVSTTKEHLSKLIYMEQVIRETLRLYPVAPYILRECTNDTKISKCVIPSGATVVISVYSLQRDLKTWGWNADKFDPDRFESSKINKQNPYAFLAFSRGPRDCLGIKYAYISMKIMLVNLLRRYKFSTNLKMENITMRLEITMKMVCGALVQAERRMN